MDIKTFVKSVEGELYALLKDLCHIPAPSYKEDARAQYCKKWLCDLGAEGVYIDKAKNVIFPYNCQGSNDITAVVAHTDTVFSDLEPMPYKEEDGKIFCPGVGDDTASLAVMLMCIKYMLKSSVIPQKGILFVCNSCEEGLGNLLGTRTFMEEYKGRIKQFISFDSNIELIADRCVGSHRYKVSFLTPGGHSYLEFPGTSAIHAAAKVINKIYSLQLPQKPGEKTTLNVGIVEGGTSVNTIAQSASILCEYRSTDVECLEYMKKEYFKIFEEANQENVKVLVECVGERPCADKLDPEKQKALAEKCREIIERVAKIEVKFKSSSTDCNIPLSLGIPAACVGVYRGSKMHTREEYIIKDSVISGLEVGISLLSELTE